MRKTKAEARPLLCRRCNDKPAWATVLSLVLGHHIAVCRARFRHINRRDAHKRQGELFP